MHQESVEVQRKHLKYEDSSLHLHLVKNKVASARVPLSSVWSRNKGSQKKGKLKSIRLQCIAINYSRYPGMFWLPLLVLIIWIYACNIHKDYLDYFCVQRALLINLTGFACAFGLAWTHELKYRIDSVYLAFPFPSSQKI